MVGLAIPGFIIGLNGLAAIFDKSCLVWKTIAQAQDFGEDVADWMRKLEMEFFRFQTWWTALEHLATNSMSNSESSNRRGETSLSSSESPLVVQLRDRDFEHPITRAAASVYKLLEEIEAILRENGVLAISQQQPSPAQPEAALSADFSKQRQIAFAKDLLQKTPWVKRYKHDARPWKASDKSALESKLTDIIYWNQSLHDILPQNIRDSVLHQGISGYILQDEDEAEKLSKLGGGLQGRDAPLCESANLFAVRRRFRDGVKPDDNPAVTLKKRKLEAECFNLPATIDMNSQYSIVEYTPDRSGEFAVMYHP
jgi:hypothetical protein